MEEEIWNLTGRLQAGAILIVVLGLAAVLLRRPLALWARIALIGLASLVLTVASFVAFNLADNLWVPPGINWVHNWGAAIIALAIYGTLFSVSFATALWLWGRRA